MDTNWCRLKRAKNDSQRIATVCRKMADDAELHQEEGTNSSPGSREIKKKELPVRQEVRKSRGRNYQFARKSGNQEEGTTSSPGSQEIKRKELSVRLEVRKSRGRNYQFARKSGNQEEGTTSSPGSLEIKRKELPVRQEVRKSRGRNYQFARIMNGFQSSSP